MADLHVLEPYNIQKRPLSDEEPNRLCSRCVDLDISKLWSSTGTKIALGTVETWNLESCVFCKFLAEILLPTIEESHQTQGPQVDAGQVFSKSYFLYSMKTRKASMRLLQKLEPRMLVLSDAEHGHPPKGVPYLAVHPSQQPFWLRQIHPQVDFEQLKEWLGLCTEIHAGHCRGDRKNAMVNLQLIDCNTEEVVHAEENDIYVALSYVWGQEGESNRKTSRYPRTIKDAITVTLKLGYNRLWVDKYCINQTDQHEFSNQLQQMDAIYQQAVVTLIAAAGTHAEYGLPGVGEWVRIPNSSVKVGQHHLSAIRGVPDLHSDDFKYTKRAWTYQESLLSTRRLVFTEDQVYFECQGFYCTEMLDIPRDLWMEMHHRNHPYLHSLYRVAPYMGVFPLDGCGVDPWDVYSRINEYSRRELTFQADILRGILGIFRAFERGKNPMRHLYGIPFPQVALTSPNKPASETGSKRVLPTFSESLRWTLEKPSDRRKGFPSWSWIGWFGTITWPPEYVGDGHHNRTSRRMERPRDAKLNETAISISVGLRDGTRISWQDFQAHYHDLLIYDKLNGIIFLEAYTTPALYLREGRNSTIYLSLRCLHGQPIILLANRTIKQDFRPQHAFLAIHFHHTVSGDQDKSALAGSGQASSPKIVQHFLIVQDVGTHWERVAYGTYTVDPVKKLERTRQCVRLG